MLGQCGQDRELVWLQPGRPEQGDSRRQVGGSGAPSQLVDGTSQLFGRAGAVELDPELSPQLGLPGAVTRQRLAGGVHVSALGPGVQHGRPRAGVAREELGEVPGGGPTAAAPGGRAGGSRIPARGRTTVVRPSPRRGWRRSLSAGARPPAAGPRGRAGRRPGRARPGRERRAAGGKGTRPRRRRRPDDPRRLPAGADRRWESQRSTPGVGTATISPAKGSGSGVLSSSPSASTRRSARSARWICRLMVR